MDGFASIKLPEIKKPDNTKNRSTPDQAILKGNNTKESDHMER